MESHLIDYLQPFVFHFCNFAQIEASALTIRQWIKNFVINLSNFRHLSQDFCINGCHTMLK